MLKLIGSRAKTLHRHSLALVFALKAAEIVRLPDWTLYA